MGSPADGSCYTPKSWLNLGREQIISGVHYVARNGDESRFNRKREQKFARGKRSLEPLELAAKTPKSEDTSVQTQPRFEWA